MSLATRCPACGTAFRVVQDQLRVSDGWVRCGQCQEVFNALEGLFDLRAPVPGAEVAAPPEPAPAAEPDEFVLTDEPSAPAPSGREGDGAHGTAVAGSAAGSDTDLAAAAVAPADASAGGGTPAGVGPVFGSSDGSSDGSIAEPIAEPHAGPGAPPPEPGLDFDLDMALDGPEPPPATAPPGGPAAADDPPPPTADAGPREDADAVPDRTTDPSADASGDAYDAPIEEPPIEPPPRRAVPPGLRLRERARARAQARAEAADGADGPPPMAIALDDEAPGPSADAAAATDSPAESSGDRKRRRRRTPGFVADAERAARWQRPGVRAALGVAALLLVAGALAQAGWLFRDELSARHPGLTPALQALCRPLGCTVQAPRALQRLSVEGATLNRLTDGDAAAATHRLSVLVRNAADHRVAAPAIDLALSDATGRPIARRVLQGRELGDGVAGDIAAGGEWSVQLALRVDDPRVAGFTVEIFYP